MALSKTDIKMITHQMQSMSDRFDASLHEALEPIHTKLDEHSRILKDHTIQIDQINQELVGVNAQLRLTNKALLDHEGRIHVPEE